MAATDADATARRAALVERALAAVESRLAERRDTHPPPDAREFPVRYEHLVLEVRAALETVPEIDVESIGRTGMRAAFPEDEREVRITPLEDQELVHFVFGHKSLGRRAEHHASPPFGDHPPDLLKLSRQLVRFLLSGAEPRWLPHRSTAESSHGGVARDDPTVLELPLE